MEVQITNFENAAFIVFMALMRRAIPYFYLNFYIPMESVAENMGQAVKIDSVNQEQFWFLESVLPQEISTDRPRPSCTARLDTGTVYRRMKLQEIVCGSSHLEGHNDLNRKIITFPRLVPIIRPYLDFVKADSETRQTKTPQY
ncbi:glutamate-cysteine ligase catalytic subunit [Aspergillus leporis]|uniref:Glutamate--cysteine ligase n=1 Tax=Aspergillus leporis TaxID=41062 RepID=A0A5N5WQI3_9EURO|nr:glutamate-cysteine ligase catalytic subunit [Aspergillus leporis]